jgi:UDP-perosamine 4-acetyltransferase
VLLDAMLVSGICVNGIIDPRKSIGSIIFGVPVLGDDAWLNQADPRKLTLANGLGAPSNTILRKTFFKNWTRKGFQFESIRHPTASIGREVVLSDGSQIMAGVILQCSVKIGENAVVNTRASVDHGCEIGPHAFIGPGVTLCGDVHVGDGAFIGAGATVLPGINIGQNAIVGAGAVVIREVANGNVVTGNPAREIGRR